MRKLGRLCVAAALTRCECSSNPVRGATRLYATTPAAATARTPSPQAMGFFEELERQGPRPRVEILDLTKSSEQSLYATVMELQRDVLARRLHKEQPGPDTLILVEHSPVYTLGRGATLDNVLFDSAAPGAPELARVERGGDVTYHGPGQLVCYPILDLRDYKQDSHWYLRALEEVVIRTCDRLGATGAERHEEHTGVWMRGRKIAAAGVALRRWVTFHGISLNIAPEMAAYEKIVPCGLTLEPVGALNHELSSAVSLRDVVPHFLAEFEAVFDADLVEPS